MVKAGWLASRHGPKVSYWPQAQPSLLVALPLEMSGSSIPDQASFKSETDRVMIMRLLLSFLEEMGARDGQTFPGLYCPRSGFLLLCSASHLLLGPLVLLDGSTIRGENREALSCLKSHSLPTMSDRVTCVRWVGPACQGSYM